MAACCLCKKDVKSDKKRKLHNEACREEKKLLEQFLQTSIAKELSDFEETKGEDAWLCYNCESELNKLEKFRKAANELEAHLLALASSLNPVSRDVTFVRKRPPPSSAAATSKAFCSAVEDVAVQFSEQSTEQSPPVAVS